MNVLKIPESSMFAKKARSLLNKQQNNFSEVMAGMNSVHKLLAPLQLILQDA